MNKPKVAVLLFGQARYIDINYKSLREEFCFEDGTQFDIFAHFWRNTGFSPKGESDGLLYDYTEKIQRAKEHLNFKRLVIDDDNQLEEFCLHTENVLRVLNKHTFSGTKNVTKNYKWGQHLSLLKAYNLLKGYENKFNLGTSDPLTKESRCNTQRYDVIIKGRTDFTYKNINCFRNEEDYYTQKADNYLSFPSNKEPVIKTCGVQFQQYNRLLEKWDNNPNIKIQKGNCVDFDKLNWKRDQDNIFRIADISLAANRSAAVHFFAEHLNVFLHTVLNDYFNRDNKTYDRHDAVQGDVAYYNKIKVYKTICRFFRLARDWDCKVCWRNTNKNGTVVFPSLKQESYEFILTEIKRLCDIKKEPAPFG